MSKKIILFQGDSITDTRRVREEPYNLGEGYVPKVASVFPEATFINRGISGNRADHLLARWKEDALDLKPDFISIFIGINEIWQRLWDGAPTTTESFETHYRSLLTQIVEHLPDTKILMIEPFILPIGVYDPRWRPALDEEIHVVRRLAKEFADYFIPMDGIFAEHALKYPYVELAGDGVHPSQLGHQLIANEVIKRLQHYFENK